MKGNLFTLAITLKLENMLWSKEAVYLVPSIISYLKTDEYGVNLKGFVA